MPASIVLRVLHLPPRRSGFINTPAAGMSTPPQDGSACNYNWGADATGVGGTRRIVGVRFGAASGGRDVSL